MQKSKRIAALFLGLVLAVQGINLETLVVSAENDYIYSLSPAKFAGSGNQNAEDGTMLIATNSTPGASGSSAAGAFISGTTANSSEGILGGTRIGGIEFTLPQGVTVEQIQSATLTINVTGVNGNMGSGWTKAALFETRNPVSWDVTAEDVTATGATAIPARGSDYSYDATIWSNEQISASNTGEKTFDVTNAVINAINDGNGKIVLRLQTVRSGFYVNTTDALPTLEIDTAPRTTATVNFKVTGAEDNFRTETIAGLRAGDSYDYGLTEPPASFMIGDDIYDYDSENPGNVDSISSLSENPGLNVITLYYKLATVSGAAETVSVLTRVKTAPVLPTTVLASIGTSGATRTEAVTWETVDSSKYAQQGTFTVTGTFDANTAVTVTAAVEVVDSEALNEAITTIKGELQSLSQEDYTEVSWNALQTALNNAENVINNPSTTIANMDNALAALNNAKNALTKITYTVTFDPANENDATIITVVKGEKVSEPEKPVRSGYTFAGWIEANTSNYFDFRTPITADVTLTAKWTAYTAKSDISNVVVTVARTVYNGKKQQPKVTVTYNGKTLTLNKDYTAAYKNNKNSGKATAVVTGIGNYTGTKSVYFNILPKANKVTKLTNKKGRKLTVKLSKSGSADGYQVWYAKNSKFKSAKKKLTTNNTITLNKLNKNKTYHVKVRAYKKIGGKKVWSSFSKAEKIKITK